MPTLINHKIRPPTQGCKCLLTVHDLIESCHSTTWALPDSTSLPAYCQSRRLVSKSTNRHSAHCFRVRWLSQNLTRSPQASEARCFDRTQKYYQPPISEPIYQLWPSQSLQKYERFPLGTPLIILPSSPTSTKYCPSLVELSASKDILKREPRTR